MSNAGGKPRGCRAPSISFPESTPEPSRPDPRRCEICGTLHAAGPFGRPCHYVDLRRALGELEPNARDDRFLRWLASFDADTADALSSLFGRLRRGERS